jgi:hypothetical protein
VSARKRPSTEEQKTSIYDSNAGKRAKSETRKGFESGQVPTIPDIGTPTQIDPPRERSEPIRVISMKSPAEIAADKKQAKQHKVQIRALSDVRPQHQTPPRGMGYLAPPADPKERKVRKVRDWLIWGSVLVIIACVVMLAVWFLATR